MKIILPLVLIVVLCIWSCKGSETSEVVTKPTLVETSPASVIDSTIFTPFEITVATDTLYTLLRERGLIKGANFFNEFIATDDLLDVAHATDTTFVAVLIQSGDGELVEMPGFSYETYEILYSYLAILQVYDEKRRLIDIFPLTECHSSMGEVRYLEAKNLVLSPDRQVVSIVYSKNDVHEDSHSVSSEVSIYALQNRKLVKIFRYLSIVEENSEIENQPSPYSFTKIELSDTTHNGLFDITLIETSSEGSAESEERVESFSYYWNGSEYVDL